MEEYMDFVWDFDLDEMFLDEERILKSFMEGVDNNQVDFTQLKEENLIKQAAEYLMYDSGLEGDDLHSLMKEFMDHTYNLYKSYYQSYQWRFCHYIILWCEEINYNNSYMLHKYINEIDFSNIKDPDIKRVFSLIDGLDEELNFLHKYFNYTLQKNTDPMFSIVRICDCINKKEHYDYIRLLVIKNNMGKDFVDNANMRLNDNRDSFIMYQKHGWIDKSVRYTITNKDGDEIDKLFAGYSIVNNEDYENNILYSFDDFYQGLKDEYKLGIMI